jgi:diguanylate cyclase (GGDEF)-like protein
LPRRQRDGAIAPCRAAFSYSCNGTPTGYQRGTLWLRVDLDTIPIPRNDLVLSIHNTRFDALSVGFVYADGVTAWQGVHGGDFGTHWRPGAQIAFAAPDREAPLRTIVLQFDRLTSYDLLRMRLATQGDGALEVVALAACVGAALMLLFIAALYNISLSFAVRRQFPAWQAAWAGCMVIWGRLVAAQPVRAARHGRQLFRAALYRAIVPRGDAGDLRRDHRARPPGDTRCPADRDAGAGHRHRRAGRALELHARGAAGILGLRAWYAGACGSDGDHGQPDHRMAARQRAGARFRRCLGGADDHAGGDAVPADGPAVLGRGSQMLVLLAATWQTIWVSVSATRRLGRLRVERDHALQAEAIAHDLARRDPLTGLRNRRGFTEAIEPMVSGAAAGDSPFALLLIDVDRFKVVNDTHGHDAGDQVLCIIARQLERWEGALCLPARFGGEEFALAISGLHAFAATQFAESLREDIAAADYGAVIGAGRITVSIGLATATEDADFRSLPAGRPVAVRGQAAGPRLRGRQRSAAGRWSCSGLGSLTPADAVAQFPASIRAWICL